MDGSCIAQAPTPNPDDDDDDAGDDEPPLPDEGASEGSSSTTDLGDAESSSGDDGSMTSGSPDPSTTDVPVDPGSCGCGWLARFEYWECSADPQPDAQGSLGLCPISAFDLYGQWLDGAPAHGCEIEGDAGEPVTIDFVGCCLDGLASLYCDDSVNELVFATCAGNPDCNGAI
ncbi:MAG: hypothetical protein AAGA54_00405 [Myxococcota bacterium]